MHTVQALEGQSENMQVDLSEALAQDGQLIITNEDGNGEKLRFSFKIKIIIPAISFPSRRERNDHAARHSTNVPLTRPATTSKLREYRLCDTDAGTKF